MKMATKKRWCTLAFLGLSLIVLLTFYKIMFRDSLDVDRSKQSNIPRSSLNNKNQQNSKIHKFSELKKRANLFSETRVPMADHQNMNNFDDYEYIMDQLQRDQNRNKIENVDGNDPKIVETTKIPENSEDEKGFLGQMDILPEHNFPSKNSVKSQKSTSMGQKTQTYMQTKIPTSNCSYLSKNDLLVRNCITNDIIGRVPGNIRTKTFNKRVGAGHLIKSPERGEGRSAAFGEIYKNRAWGQSWDGNKSGLDASGRGATLIWTQEVTAVLHTTLNQIKQDLGISKVKLLDIPCGDMIWMSRFLETRDDVIYTGMDIVPELIKRHQQNFKNPNWNFINLDIVDDNLLGEYHLILCRTLLQHLYTADVFRVLRKLSSSGSHYLLMTTFSTELFNSELDMANNPGRFREINLEIPPYSLIPPLCLHRDGPPGDFEGWKHYLGLWRLPLRQVADCDRVKEFKLMGTSQEIGSCIEWSPYIDLDS